MWQEAMRQIGEDYPGDEVHEEGCLTVKGGGLWIEFYENKRIIADQHVFRRLNLFKLYKIWNDHEKIF